MQARSPLEVEWRDYLQGEWGLGELRVPGSGLVHNSNSANGGNTSPSSNPELGTRRSRGVESRESRVDQPSFIGRRFTVAMVAQQYVLTEAEARKLIRAEMPHLKFGRELVVREGDLLVWEAKRLGLPEVLRSGNGYTLDLQIQMACALDLLRAAGRIPVNWRKEA